MPKRDGSTDPEPVSVQDMRHAMKFIREAMESGDGPAYSSDAMAQIFPALFDKIHPLAIGAIEQSYALAKLIGRRCLATHMTGPNDAEKIEKIVDVLCDDFKSHTYQIGRGEAKAIGLKVRDADPAEDKILLDLLKFYQARPVGPFGAGLEAGQEVEMQIAWLDSSRLKMRVMQKVVVGPKGELQSKGDQWVPY